MNKNHQRTIKDLLRMQVDASNKISNAIEEIIRFKNDEDNSLEVLEKAIDSIKYNMDGILGYNKL